MPDAVIFDLDGVLADSERLWNQAKEALVQEAGGRWREDAPRAMMGMSSGEWSAYLRDELNVPGELESINQGVVARMEAMYRERVPVLPGAVEAVEAIAARWPVALASSSNREIIDLFLELTSLNTVFGVTVSSEEVARGKPAPDVYLEAAQRLGVSPSRCVAVEDSSNGLRAAAAAGMPVVAAPNADYPPEEDALALAAARLDTVGNLTVELIESLG